MNSEAARGSTLDMPVRSCHLQSDESIEPMLQTALGGAGVADCVDRSCFPKSLVSCATTKIGSTSRHCIGVSVPAP